MFVQHTLSLDKIPKKIRRKLRVLKIEGYNPAEIRYMRKTKNHPNLHKASEKSPKMGFTKIHDFLQNEFFERHKFSTMDNHIKQKRTFKDRLHMIPIILQGVGAGRGMIFRQYRHLSRNKRVDKDAYEQLDGKQLWKEMETYAREKWGIQKIGFTEVPRDIIFQGRHILFKYALVFIEEMRKPYIDDAPHLKAGFETMRAYNHLGKTVLDIAQWLRKKGIRTQANHPLGGLVSFVPLAGKAGLGWQGMNGLLVTQEFGIRQRIAPIFIEHPIFEFTDKVPLEHNWIEDYCKTCKICYTECNENATDAIQEEKTIYNNEIPTIGRLARALDPVKCFPMFSRFVGCSLCIKVCPFSQGPGVYEKIKRKFVK